jgi:thiol-disulfide isomerase/thioredoxin
MRRALPYAGAALLVLLLVLGLKQAGGNEDTGTPSGSGGKPDQFDLAEAQRRLRGAPPPLAALHDQASDILSGGKPAFERRMRALRGHPVVVNKWASWCGPCRHEFPFFEHVSTQRGKQVAFVGVDGKDGRAPATDFLKDFPLTYPSYEDPKEDIARAIGAPANYPITVFFDEHGKQAFIRQGGYASQAQLNRDIDRYLLHQG